MMQNFGFVIDFTCDKDRGYSVPGILCSHPRSLPSANFKVLIFARKLLHRKIKVKDIIRPARIEIRQLKFTYDVWTSFWYPVFHVYFLHVRVLDLPGA